MRDLGRVEEVCDAAVARARASGLKVAPGYLYFSASGGICLVGALLLFTRDKIDVSMIRPGPPPTKVAAALGVDESIIYSLEHGFEGWPLLLPKRLRPDSEAAALGLEIRLRAARVDPKLRREASLVRSSGR